MESLNCSLLLGTVLLLTLASQGSTSFTLEPSRTVVASISASNMTQMTSPGGGATTPSVTTEMYWIRRSPDYTVLYVTVPIAAGMLFTVLVFFLWIFSAKPETLDEDFQYERLEEEPVAGSSSSGPHFPPSASPTYPVVDQILDLPYTNPLEVNDDLPSVV